MDNLLENKPKKDKFMLLCIIFRVSAIIIFLGSIVCGVLFGFSEITRFTASTTIVKETVFEVWKLLLFLFSGIGSGGALLGCSFAFKELSNIKSKKK